MRHTIAICGIVSTLLLAGNLSLASASGAGTGGTVSARDATATLVYLRAEIRIQRALTANMPASRAAVATLEHGVAGGCPEVLAQAPHEQQVGDVTAAIFMAAFATVLSPNRQTLRSALSRIEPLRWSDGGLTRLVARQRRVALIEASLHAPHLCAAARAWIASSYHRLPAGITALDDALRRIVKVAGKDLSSGPGIQKLLQRYESKAGRRLADRLATLEGKDNVLGLKPL
ncbi:MAG: hypothetical protein ACYCXW_08545, partial [Solirubrobacteraceae bacterium]